MYLITGSPETPLLDTTSNGFFSGLRSQTWTVSSEAGPHRLSWGFLFDQSWGPLRLEDFRLSYKMSHHDPAPTDAHGARSLCLIQSHIWPPFSGPAPLHGLQPAQGSVAGSKGSYESGQSLLQVQEKSCLTGGG